MPAPHDGGVLWPDDRELALLNWWEVPAWSNGPTFGALIGELRPVLRAAVLLGYEVISINVGEGAGVSPAGEWQTIDGEALELVPGPEESITKLAAGVTVWLETMPLADLLDDYGGPYAIEFDFGQFGSDEPVNESNEEPAEPGTVPYEISNAVGELIGRAVDALAASLPATEEWEAEAAQGRGLPRVAGGGLLWMLDPVYQQGLGAAKADLAAVVKSLLADRELFLLGQIYAERAEHDGGDLSGPANLLFLLTHQAAWLSQPDRVHGRIWKAILAELRATGRAHWLWEQNRADVVSASAPTWLDVLTQLMRRGVIRIEALYEPQDAAPPLGASTAGDTDTVITLTVWGTKTIVLRRKTVFADGRNEGLSGSVAWDYAPGTAQVKPTLILVAGRGVAIEWLVDKAAVRPWQLEIFRVQDDRLVPRLGSRIDPAALLGTSEIVPQATECVFDPNDIFPPLPEFAPQILVKPTPSGVRLVYPVCGGTLPTTTVGPITGTDTPCVVELTVNPLSGTAAYAIDAYYHTGEYLNVPANIAFKGGVHVCVWITGDVTITASNSDNTSAPARGNPSVVYGWSAAHQFVAEFWQVETPALGSVAQHPLPRPWSVELPVTGWTDMFPPTIWDLVRQEMWEGLVHQSIQDFLSSERDDALMIPAPHVSYDSAAQRASWRDPVSGTDYVLRPALHAFAAFGETDSLFLDVIDTGVALIPIFGDVVDIAEVVYVWQTGRDRWGRPVTDYQLAQMMFFAVVPFVSSSFLQAAAVVLSGLPQLAAETLYSRLFVPAAQSLAYSIEQAQAALGQLGVLRPATPAGGSPQRAQAAEGLMTQLATDASARDQSPAWALASQLIGGTQDGWVSVDDLLSEDLAGFRATSLQIPYTRFLRDNPGVEPADWFEAADG